MKAIMRLFSLLLISLWLAVTGLPKAAMAAETTEMLAQHLSTFKGNNFAQKKQAVEQIAQLNNESSHTILIALLEGRLWVDDQEYYVRDTKNTSRYQQVLSHQQVEIVSQAKKVIINNDIRSWLCNYQAQAQLMQGNKEQRLGAMDRILKSNDFTQLDNVKAALAQEKNSSIQSLMHLFIARADLKSDDISRHGAAIAILGDSVLPEDLTFLQTYVTSAPTESLQKQAEKAISRIKNKLLLVDGVQTLSYGLSLGSILILTAIGLAITFGVMGVINMAHGYLRASG